jgi:hypothetical protein
MGGLVSFLFLCGRDKEPIAQELKTAINLTDVQSVEILWPIADGSPIPTMAANQSNPRSSPSWNTRPICSESGAGLSKRSHSQSVAGFVVWRRHRGISGCSRGGAW